MITAIASNDPSVFTSIGANGPRCIIFAVASKDVCGITGAKSDGLVFGRAKPLFFRHKMARSIAFSYDDFQRVMGITKA